jgi:thiamine biosynthesis protein ThiI
VFGLTSLSTVTRVPREMDAIAEECVRQAQRAGVDPSVSYRVQARRADKTFPFTSPEINRLAGEAVARATDGLIDLSKNADVTLGVEVREDGALIFGRIIPRRAACPWA